MQLILIILGAVLGGWIADLDAELLGLALGAVAGYLVAEVRALRVQLAGLERQAAGRDRPIPMPAAAAPPPAVDADSGRAAAEPARNAYATAGPAAPPAGRGRALPERLWALARRWLTTGNVPVKLGVIVSFFGVAFLLKYAVDNNVLVVPIELRLLAVTAGAAALLIVGWRLRNSSAVYALSLQGGGIGVLYLTIFAAFRLYALLPAPLAFALLVLLTAGAGLLAVVQNAHALAVLGSVGGFLAPVLVSTGTGSHVALFSYYLLLNAALLGIAWYRAWRVLNLIGFAFTFGIASLWGYRYYQPEFYASTQPFLILYFLFYQAIAILFALRQAPDLRGLVDGTILFGTPVIAFALQAALVDDTRYGLAVSAAAVAVFYVLLASGLYRRYASQMRLLVESYAALGVAFATLALPLALDDRWTAAAWALEGAALVWLGVRQDGLLAKASGAFLLFASGAAFLRGGWAYDASLPVLNGNLSGGWLIALSSLFAARRLAVDDNRVILQASVSVALLLWALAWWFGTGAGDIADHVPAGQVAHALLVFLAASSAALAWLARRLQWAAARRATLAMLPVASLFGVWYLIEYGHFLSGAGWIGWSAAVMAHGYLLWCYAEDERGVESLWHLSGVVLLASLAAVEVHWQLDRADLSASWTMSAALAVLPLTAWLLYGAQRYLRWPLQPYARTYALAAGLLVAAQLALIGVAGLDNPGDPAPLPYVPLLNPFDVVTVFGLMTALYYLLRLRAAPGGLPADRARTALMVWAAVAFVLTTMAVVRGVHHVAGVAWIESQLFRSVSVQAALSIYWGMLAFAGMIAGARRASRLMWVVGTVLMALVVGKLFLIDLGNTGTVARIVSFLGVGGLLLVVGYFAPAPPRRVET